MSSGEADLCVFAFAKYPFTYFIVQTYLREFLILQIHLFILRKIFLRSLAFHVLTFLFQYLPFLKKLVNLCSFKLLGLFFYDSG